MLLIHLKSSHPTRYRHFWMLEHRYLEYVNNSVFSFFISALDMDKQIERKIGELMFNKYVK